MISDQVLLEAVYARAESSSHAEAARKLNIAPSTLKDRLAAAGRKGLKLEGKIAQRKTVKRDLPARGRVKRYILTCAQNNTQVNQLVWDNLKALAEFYDAEIMVGRFTYNQNKHGTMSVKPGTEKPYDHDLWYDPRIHDFVCDDRVMLAPGLVWCGEMNTLPTAVNPLSGFATYTQEDSGIFPHVKLCMESVANGKHEQTKFNYTTGTVTKSNYIQKKAGIKAEFHHVYGGLIVEVDDQGDWWVRQLTANTRGDIYDLDIMVSRGDVYESEVEAIIWGDIHTLALDPVMEECCWGEGGMLDTLKPRQQIYHDLLAGARLNHHDWNDIYTQYLLHLQGLDSVAKELDDAADFLIRSSRDWCKGVVVWSNHDNPWIEKWLQKQDYRTDPVNAITHLELQLEKYKALRDGRLDFNLLEHAMRQRGVPSSLVFLDEDESYTICRNQIECGMHGHLGPGGARGTAQNLRRIGKRACVMHSHQAGIYEGLFVGGTSTYLNWRWAKGPNAWSHSHILAYPNGKRTIVTVRNGKWRADG